MKMPDESTSDYPYLVLLRIGAEHDAEVTFAIAVAIRSLQRAGVRVMSHGRARNDEAARSVMVNVDADGTAEAEWNR